MIDKRNIINFLFVSGFPVYGIGSYVAASQSPTAGYFISISPYLLIILFYCVDLAYKRTFTVRLNVVYALMLLFQVSCIVSLFIALANGLPDTSMRLTTGRAIALITPFHAFLVVGLYNERCPDIIARLTLISLSLLLAINLIGYYGLGWTNAFHSIEGRLSMPFFDGFYSGANVLAIINIILLWYLSANWRSTLVFVLLAAYFVFNFMLFYLINSRLSMLVFLLVVGLALSKLIRSRIIYPVSMFTIPLLLSSGLMLYGILQHPLLVSLVQRVDIIDVTTFNGRSYLWSDALDWLFHDHRGLVFGNGYKGHYFLDLIPDVVKLWNAEESHHLHLHSTSLETLVSQGLVFFLVLCVILFIAHRYFCARHRAGREEGALFPVVVYLLFIMQVDTFMYLDSLGAAIFALLVSRTALHPARRFSTSTGAEIRGAVTPGAPGGLQPTYGENGFSLAARE